MKKFSKEQLLSRAQEAREKGHEPLADMLEMIAEKGWSLTDRQRKRRCKHPTSTSA